MEKAAQGPWYIDTRMTFGFPEFKSQPDGKGVFYYRVFKRKDEITQQLICETHTDRKENAEFISASRTDIEKLVARVEELTEALNDIRRETCGFVELKKLSGPIIQLQKIYQITLIADPCKKVLSKEVPE